MGTSAGGLAASVTGTGNIFLDEENAVTLAGIVAADGDITITAGNTITLGGQVFAKGSAVSLNAAAGNIDIDADITSFGTITLTADTNITLSDADVGAPGTVTLTATNCAITEDGADENDFISTAGTLVLSAATGIGETGDADIDIRAIRLAAETTSAGVGADIFVSSNDNLMTTTVGGVTGVSTAGDNDITIFTTGNLTIGDLDPLTGSEPVAAAGAGNVSLSGSDININENISTATGEITLTASDEISTDGTAKVETTSDGFGTLQLNAANDIGSAGIRIRTDVDTFAARLTGATPGDIKVNQIGVTQTELEIGTGSSLSGINTSTGGGNILVQAEAGNIALADVASIINAGAGNVTIGATAGDITVANATAQVEIASTGTVDLTGGAIGATGNEMDLNGATVLVIGDTGAGNIVLRERGASTIGATTITVADASSGDIDITCFGGDGVDINAGHILNNVTLTDSEFSYTAQDGGITATLVNTGTQNLTLTGAGTVGLGNVDTTLGNVNVMATGTITVSNAGVTTASDNVDLNSSGGAIVAAVAADTTAEIATGGGDITLEANAGGITDSAGTGAFEIDAGNNAVIGLTVDGAGDAIVAYVSSDPDALTFSAAHSDTGNISFDGQATGLLTVNASSTAASDLTIRSDDGIAINQQLDTSTGGGNILVQAQTGNIALADVASIVNAGAGNVTLKATAGDITVANTTGQVEVDSTGTVDLTGGAIGSGANQLDMDGATALLIRDTGAGNIALREQGSSTIAQTTITVVDATSGNIDIGYFGGDVVDINQGHDLFNVALTDSGFGYAAEAGGITATQVNTGAENMGLLADTGTLSLLNVDTTSGDVDVFASGTITVSNVGVTTTGGNVALNSFTGAIVSSGVADGTAEIASGSGDIALEVNAGGITDSLGSGAFEIDSGGGVVTLVRDGAGLVNVGYVATTADAVSLSITDTGTGNLVYDSESTGTLTLGTITLPDGSLTVSNGATIAVTGVIDTSGGAIDDLSLTAGGAGDVTLDDVDNILTAGDGPVTLTADGNAITVADTNAGGGIEILSGGAVILTANTIGATNEHLDLDGATALVISDTGAGAIFIDENTGSTIAATAITVADATSGNIAISYFNTDSVNISSGHDLNVDLDQGGLSFSYTASAGGITATQVNTGAENLTLTADTGTVSLVNVDTTSGNVDVVASGTITVSNAGVTTTGGNVDLNSSGGAIVAAVAADTTAEIATGGGDITLEANAGGITDSAGTGAFEIDAGNNAVIGLTVDGAGDAIVAYVSSDPDALTFSATHSDTGNVSFDSQATGLLTVNASSTAASDLTIRSDDGIAINQQLDTSTGGNILVQAEAGSIALADVTSILNAGTGNVTLEATAGDITVANATTQVEIASTGTLDLTGGAIGATGNELDLNGAVVLVIDDTGAGNIVLREQGASTIGSTTITVADATSGNIDITYIGGDIVNIDQGHDLFNVALTDSAFSYTASAGGITATQVNTGAENLALTADTGTVSLLNVDTTSGNVDVVASGTITVSNGGVTTTGGNVDLNSSGGAIVAAAAADTTAAIATGGGDITLEANAGGITDSAGTGAFEIDAGNNAVIGLTVDGAGDAIVGYISSDPDALIFSATHSDTGNVSFDSQATGLLTVNASSTAASDLTIRSDDGIAIIQQLDTSTGGGNILVQAETGNIAIADVASIINAGAGNVTLEATAGDIAVTNATAQVEIASTGTVDLTGGAIGATGNEMDLNGATVLVIGDTGAGNIVLREQGSSTIGSTAITVADATSGSIDIAYNNGDSVSIADGHDLTVDLNQGGSSFSYTATAGDLLVGTVDVTGNHVSLSTIDGSILDNTSLITANSAALDAGGLNKNIGISGTPINVTVANLEAQATGGGIFISSPTQGLTLGGANTDLGGVSTTAGNGEINIDATGTMVVNEAVTADGSGDVSLSATDNLTVNPTFSISSVTGIIELAADSNGIGTGDLNLHAGSSVITGNTTAGAITLRGADLAIDGTADVQATGAGGGIRLFTSLGTRTMNIGGGPAAADFNVKDAELNRLKDFETLTIGERLVQVGTVTLTTVDHATVNDAAIVVNADSGAGGIVLNDDSTGPALNGGIGTIALTAGTGGITAAQANYGFAELSTTGATVTLNTGGTIGTGPNRIQLADNTNTA